MSSKDTFEEFQEMNWQRCQEAFPSQCQDVRFLALAIAGEAGELCNLVKKVERGDVDLNLQRKAILKEIADVMTYCDLLMSRLNARTVDELYYKFIEVNRRVGWPGGNPAKAGDA